MDRERPGPLWSEGVIGCVALRTVERDGVDGRVGDGDDGDAVGAHLHGGGALGHLRQRQRRRGGAGARTMRGGGAPEG